MNRRVFWGLLAIIIVVGLGSGAWWFWAKGKTPPVVRLSVVNPVSIHEEIYATGSLNPISQQDIRVINPGKVSRVAVKVGDTVKTGQLLLELDKTLADAQVSQAKANLQVARATLTNSQAQLSSLKDTLALQDQVAKNTGNPQGNTLNVIMSDPNTSVPPASSSSSLKQAELAVTQSQAMVKQAEEGLKVAEAQRAQLSYKANINGKVLQVNVSEGNLTPVQLPLVLVADVSTLVVDTELNEVDAGKVKLDQKVKVTSKVLGDRAVDGTINQIAPQAVTKPTIQANPAPTVEVSIKLNSVPEELKPGYTVNVQILTSPKEGVLVVPQESLFQEGNRNFVYKFENNHIYKTEVKVGLATSTQQEIISGLAKGDRVVLNPTTQMQDQMVVTPENGSVSQ